MDVLETVKNNLIEKEKKLSIYATKSSDAIRLKEMEEDIRPSFFHDTDTIIHSSLIRLFSFKNITEIYFFYFNIQFDIKKHFQIIF